uniref:p9 protein n=1 Tax=Cystovirus phi6 TaxID=10879 RepID=D7R9S9_9VIRU|nr:P9 protein [Cystovirus phi6]ADI49965.1 P9 protein [Cystovirus phi6]ADI49969.1 P9 protein [Cystovirus phi6]ADI49973.1 P9 protein [Cystovirus phi6]ADI49978.1 P9 protein [Cystovirus phi6]
MPFPLVKQDPTSKAFTQSGDRSTGTQILDVVKAPLGLFGDDAKHEFVTRQEQAVSVVSYAVVAGLIGELIGYRGARSGRKAILANIPFLA